MRLDNKVVLVTGGGKGIGKGLAMDIGQAGADVALTYNASARGAQEVVEQLRKLGRRAIAIQANLGKVEDARHSVTATVEEFGRLDVLVYNAGITDPHPFLEMTEEEYDLTLDINLKGAFFCMQEAARVMIEKGICGSIVMISSGHAFLSFPKHAHYAASKAGMDQMVKTVANELAPYGIRINGVTPGMIEVEKYYDDDVIEGYDPDKWGPTIPLGRPGYPRDISNATIFLASDVADYMTGSMMRVDGGLFTRSPHWGPKCTYPNLRPQKDTQ